MDMPCPVTPTGPEKTFMTGVVVPARTDSMTVTADRLDLFIRKALVDLGPTVVTAMMVKLNIKPVMPTTSFETRRLTDLCSELNFIMD